MAAPGKRQGVSQINAATGFERVFARVDWDVRTGEVNRSEDWYLMTGHSPDHEDARSLAFWSDRVHPADLLRFYRAFEAFQASGDDTFSFNYRFRFADSRWHQMGGMARVAERSANGRPVRIEIREIDLEPFFAGLREEAEPVGSLRPGLAGAWSWEPGTDEVWWSREIYELTGWDPKDPPPGLEGQEKLYAPESLARLQAAVRRLAETGESYDLLLTLVRADGRRLPVRATGAITLGRHGELRRVGGTLSLLGSAEPSQAMPMGDDGAWLEVDLAGGEWLASAAATALLESLGAPAGGAEARLLALLSQESRAELRAWLDGLEGRADAAHSLSIRTLSGRRLRLWPFGIPEGARKVFLRIERDDADPVAETRGDFDPLTGLLAFDAFLAIADAQVAAAANPRRLVLFKINIDRFREVNALLGHRRGDLVLRAFAGHLRSNLPEALLTRRSGDVFVGLLPIADGIEAAGCMARILDITGAFEPEGLGLIKLKFRLGLVTADSAPSVEELVDAAAEMMSAAGPGKAALFGPVDAARLRRRREIYTLLPGVAGRGELQCVFQPSVSASGGELRGLESLVRWASPTIGAISPGEFIAMAEESGEIVSIGRWMLDRAIADFARMRRMGLEVPQVSINVSPAQFADAELADFARQTCERHAVDPSRVVLEITESVLVDGSDMTSAAIDALLGAGFVLSLDDFGTGYSNLRSLIRLKLSKVKIDMSFVRRMIEDKASLIVVDTVIRLARGLSCSVVAEGVERQEQADLLRSLGCDEIQGYLVGRPMPFGEFVAWCEGRTDAVAGATEAP